MKIMLELQIQLLVGQGTAFEVVTHRINFVPNHS
jgi:hypothetical protein